MASFNAWIAGTIGRILSDAPENRLPDFGDQPVFDAPALGIADGNDRIFRAFREVVSPAHLLPREVLEREGFSAGGAGVSTKISVVAWALPFSRKIRLSNRIGEWPSALYSVARNNGGALNLELARRVVEEIRQEGFSAVSPTLTDAYDAFRTPGSVFSSSWSERHAAFAAGLGTFGLNGFLITSLGAMVRLGSLVTDMPLDAAPAGPADHRAPCLADGGKLCGACVSRCPSGAISTDGLDKEKCYRRRNEIRDRALSLYSEKFRMIPAPIARSGKKTEGFSIGCALCASGVPCENADPFPRTRSISRA
jgi:epoxyqueuosine reductase